jgi:hypothetical protein
VSERKPHQFQPGQSGNPGGRVKGAEARAREIASSREYVADNGEKYTGAEAMLHVLIDIAVDKDEKSRERIAAANSVLDRVEGKPKQAVDVTGTMDPQSVALVEALRMTPHERRAHLARMEAEEHEHLGSGDSQDSTHADAD